ncbi:MULTISPECIES: hypothetical protein [Streptomyces]|uniref:Uncharacterized protein n=1 Tax=Streptomyces qinglanensis TaxID=943816 RepID=A0A1H9T323_9ACTN|nr:hypothetical protein [Streptomyces qinglanensis]SER91404.1 hypothetical protein SAMN05421870_105284 [Streptomyces qinglanensis]
MQQDQTTRDENARETRRPTVHVSRTASRPDGPMSYGPRSSRGDGDPESHIFRGED